jgi:hypothetical protein
MHRSMQRLGRGLPPFQKNEHTDNGINCKLPTPKRTMEKTPSLTSDFEGYRSSIDLRQRSSLSSLNRFHVRKNQT